MCKTIHMQWTLQTTFSCMISLERCHDREVNAHWWSCVVGSRRLISEWALFTLCQGTTLHSLINQRHLKPQLYSLYIYLDPVSISFTCPQNKKEERRAIFLINYSPLKRGWWGPIWWPLRGPQRRFWGTYTTKSSAPRQKKWETRNKYWVTI